MDRGGVPNIDVELQHPVFDVEISQNLHHLLENQLPPLESHPYVLEVDGVAAPYGYLESVCIINVAEHDHGARVPMFFLVVEITEIRNKVKGKLKKVKVEPKYI